MTLHRLLLPLFLAAVLLTAPLRAQAPGYTDIGQGHGTDRHPGIPTGVASDRFEALVAGMPGGSDTVEEWYQKWKVDYREEYGVQQRYVDPVEGSEEIFSGLFGEPSWRASKNKKVVLKILAVLTPPDESKPDRVELLGRILRALSRYATDRSKVRGSAHRPRWGAQELERRLLERARQGIGPDDDDELYRDFGISVWDYKAGAFALLQHVIPLRSHADAQQEDFLLDNPPEPGGDGGERFMVETAEEGVRVARETGNSERVRHLEREIRRIREISDRRAAAIRTLKQHLGEAAMTSPHMLAAAYRRKVAENRSLQPVLRQALLELGRSESQLGRTAERIALPAPAEIRQAIAETDDPKLFEGVDASSLSQRISKEVLDADLRLRAKFLDLELVPGVSLSGKYTWELEDGWRKDTWNRIDEWEVRAKLGVGSWISDVFELPFSLGIDHERKILLVREFDSWGDAAKAIPKTPFSIPLTAERARDLPMGWFWSLPVRMAAISGLTLGYTETFVGAEVFANYILSGRFRMNFFKEAEDKIRVQLIGARERGPGVGANLKFGFDIFGVRVLDKALSSLIDLRVLRYQQNWRSGLGIAMDYVYDLDDATARHAYEKAVRVSLGFGGLLATHPTIQRAEMEERLLTDLRPTEQVFLEDREKPVEERRIDRRFLATNVFKSRSKSYRIGPRLARYARNTRWMENELVVTDRDGTKEGYEFPIFNFWKGWQLLFGFWKESAEIQTFSLMKNVGGGVEGSEWGEPVGPQPLIMRATLRDRRASQDEVLDTRQLVVRNLGAHLTSQLGVQSAPVPSGGKGFRAHLLVALHPEATAKIMDMTEVSDEQVLAAAVRTIQAERPPNAPITDEVRSRAETLAAPFLLAREIPGEPGGKDQVESLIRLAELSNWRTRGMRFLLEMVGEQPTTEQVHVDIAWQGKGVERFAATYGQSRHDDLYLIISEALAAVADRDRPFGSY